MHAPSQICPAIFLTFLIWHNFYHICHLLLKRGLPGGAMVLDKLPVPGRPTVLITEGQGPIALAVGAGGGGLDICIPLSPSLWGGRVVRWCWVNFQCRGVLQF